MAKRFQKRLYFHFHFIHAPVLSDVKNSSFAALKCQNPPSCIIPRTTSKGAGLQTIEQQCKTVH